MTHNWNIGQKNLEVSPHHHHFFGSPGISGYIQSLLGFSSIYFIDHGWMKGWRNLPVSTGIEPETYGLIVCTLATDTTIMTIFVRRMNYLSHYFFYPINLCCRINNWFLSVGDMSWNENERPVEKIGLRMVQRDTFGLPITMNRSHDGVESFPFYKAWERRNQAQKLVGEIIPRHLWGENGENEGSPPIEDVWRFSPHFLRKVRQTSYTPPPLLLFQQLWMAW